MSRTQTLRIVQTVLVHHNETLVRSWFDEIARTIEREIDTDGTILRDEIVDEEVIEARKDETEEILSTDEDTEPDEICDESFD